MFLSRKNTYFIKRRVPLPITQLWMLSVYRTGTMNAVPHIVFCCFATGALIHSLFWQSVFLVTLQLGKNSARGEVKKSCMWMNRMKMVAGGVPIQWLSPGRELTTLFLEVSCKTWNTHRLHEWSVNAIENFTHPLYPAIAYSELYILIYEWYSNIEW